jgi:hypothetical protein
MYFQCRSPRRNDIKQEVYKDKNQSIPSHVLVIKVKTQLFLCLIERHAMKTCGIGGITRRNLNLGTEWR